MAQKLKQFSVSPQTVSCETYMTRLVRKNPSAVPLKPSTTTSCSHKCKERHITAVKQNISSNNTLIKAKITKKQQNVPLTKLENYKGSLECADDIEEVYINRKPKAKSNNDHEPWAYLLRNNKSRDTGSTFSNFDPLRTLHFLAKELQFQLQTVLPDDNNLHRMVNDMQHALNRVPPEVASTIHLQQAVDLLPINRRTSSSKSLFDEKPEKLQPPKPETLDKITQTPAIQDETEKIQKLMEESTLKLETSCRQMEVLCGRLKFEKEDLDRLLKIEKDSVQFLKRRVEDLEEENMNILNNKVKKLETENIELQFKVNQLNNKLASEYGPSASDLKHLVDELKQSKAATEKECGKLNHQLRLCCMEKEKHIAVLAIRDRQIVEIRNEMTQLQEVVNEQLMELHNGAFASVPSNVNMPGSPTMSNPWEIYNKENIGDIGDSLPSSIHSHEDHLQENNSNVFKELPSGDSGTSGILQDASGNLKTNSNSSHERKSNKTQLKGVDSQQSLRDKFNELKKQALGVSSGSSHRNQTNSHGKKKNSTKNKQ